MIVIMRAEKAKIAVSNRKVGNGTTREKFLKSQDANKAPEKTVVCGASSIK